MKEIEIRSKLNKEKYLELLNYLKQKDPNFIIEKHLTYQSQGEKDIRIKLVNEKYYLITIKDGKMGDLSRNEKEFKIPLNKFKETIKSINEDKFTKWENLRHKFKIDEINIDLDDKKEFGYYIEFEKICKNSIDENNIIQELKKIMKTFNLEELSKKRLLNLVKNYIKHNTINIEEIIE